MKKSSVVALLLLSGLYFGQTMKVTAEYGSKDDLTNQLMDFQNITAEKLNFTAVELIGRYPIVKIKEFKNGNLVKTETLLNPESYVKIEKSTYSLRFFTELNDQNNMMKTFIRGDRFSTARKFFPLFGKSKDYAFNDLFGSKTELFLDVKKENTLFLITTPHDQGNGFSSWCEIAQSEVAPENLGTHFKVPHYFLITIQFLDKHL